jgi:predicted nucleic acid-binding protein
LTVLLLDTNVLSELIKATTEPRVLAVLTRTPLAEIFVPAMAIAEIAYGIERLPRGARRTEIARRARDVIDHYFAGQAIAFDERIAWEAGRVRAERRALGRADDLADDIVAATARARGLTLATRNTKDFEGLGLRLMDPWRD